jgi:hypothetical protein
MLNYAIWPEEVNMEEQINLNINFANNNLSVLSSNVLIFRCLKRSHLLINDLNKQ